jgi:excisionase family DNA binding protein
MLTVPEAAQRVDRDPETIRRWIRSGRLRATKVGTQHVIEEHDLEALAPGESQLPLPDEWQTFESGRPVPNWADAVHRSRRGH